MSHHHHHETDSYFMDQICLIALAGAFAAVCLTLYFWQTDMLSRILGPQFHNYILWSGIALTVMVLIRAAAVWQAAGGRPAAASSSCCGHAEHEHAGHEHCHHEHDHSHEEHNIQLATSQAAAHSHEPGGHHHHDEPGAECCSGAHSHNDQAWTPLKCLVLLAPIVFYLLGLPSTIQSARDVSEDVNMGKEADSYAAIVASGFQPWDQVALVSASFADPTQGEVYKIGFQELEGAAYSPDRMAYWDGKTVEVPGQFVPSSHSDRVFTLARMKISCCANDATQLSIKMVSREPITGINPSEWVKVTGRVEFRPRAPGTRLYDTYLQVQGTASIKKTPPDPNPYLQ